MFKKILKKIGEIGGNTLYYPGCLTKFAAPELIDNYKKILDMISIDYITIEEFNCCGSPVIAAGFPDDMNDLIAKNKDIFKKYGVKRIISNCPGCVKIFRNYYDMRSEHITELLARDLDKIKPKYDDEPVSYHDPCHLARGLGITEEPRAVLRKLGFEIVEMENFGRRALCCGAGGGLKTNNPKLSDKIGALRLKQCRTKKLVTSCPLCYKHLKENSPDIKVLELSEVIL